MAMSAEQSRALDRVLTQLSLLHGSIASLRHQLITTDPLPPWDIIHKGADALSFNLKHVMQGFAANAQLLKEAHAYPLPSFPGHTHEIMLGQLMRKKLEPGVEEWISEHTAKSGQQVNGASKDDRSLKDEELRDLWSWASQTSSGIAASMIEDGGAFFDDYTIAEREAGIEHVVTGLKRNLEGDSEDDDDDGEEDKMEDVKMNGDVSIEDEEGIDPSLPVMPLESVLRFMTTGALPSAGRSNR